MTVWPYLLILCAMAMLWNIKLALIYAGHIVTMQIIKAYDPPQMQVWFAACYATWGLVAYGVYHFSVSSRSADAIGFGALVLVCIGAIYLAHIFGFVYQRPKEILADILFVIGLFGDVIGAISAGLFTWLGLLRANRPLDSIQDIANSHKEGH